ncbi:MAG TPA: M48 family metalloprotease [Verrucomicrobiae bacterium]|nr:M48 family metalloprotease [Verrucomicrobiae bacterium]
MKRSILLPGILLLGVAAIVLSERRKVDTPAGPAALLYLVGDTEQELTRMPVQFTRMSDEEEIRIGDDLADSYKGAFRDRNRDGETATIEQYLNDVGRPLASRTHRRLPYRFHYIPSLFMINAFALPGGHVYVGAGLLALMDSEDELAAVLGHEIEHIDHYHCADRVQQEQALRRIPLGELISIPISVFEAGYSKDQELEADREGTRLAVEAGYSANGAIRMFEVLDRLYQQYGLGQDRTRPKTPQGELSQVAMQTVEGYFRSHPLPAERIAQVQRMIASEGWPTRSERDLAIAYIFWTKWAQTALNAKKYEEAERYAAQSLKVHPVQPDAEDTLALAELGLADFAGSSKTLRAMMEGGTANPALAERYAMALAAADRRTAAHDFDAWLDSLRSEKPRNAEVERAGLHLLSGDSAPARKLEGELPISMDPWATDYDGELGWWYYLAGDYSHAAQLLNDAAEQRPGNVKTRVRRSWAEIELRRYSDALQTLNQGNYDDPWRGAQAMAQAVAFWQAKESDEALLDFERALASQPEWGNPRWVTALYSPLVARSVDEMKAERERRKKKRTAEESLRE